MSIPGFTSCASVSCLASPLSPDVPSLIHFTDHGGFTSVDEKNKGCAATNPSTRVSTTNLRKKQGSIRQTWLICESIRRNIVGILLKNRGNLMLQQRQPSDRPTWVARLNTSVTLGWLLIVTHVFPARNCYLVTVHQSHCEGKQQ